MYSMFIMVLLVIIAGWLDSRLDRGQIENPEKEKSS